MASEYSWENDPPEQVLAERFGITTGFHDGQRDIIARLVGGRRVLAIQRTGWGKSLCYQIASLYYPHLTIIFSPLKALMRDQYLRCNEVYHIPAAIVSSDFSEEENIATLLQAINNEIKILFIAPERLSNLDWQEHVTHMRISMVVVDEAHCISMWGHDFRPDYRRIVNLLNALPLHTPVLALTATANKRVEEDVLLQIGHNTEVIRGTMERPNLYLNVIHLNGDYEKLCYLATLLPQLSGTGIVYTATRNAAEMVATFLQMQGIDAQYYHAGRDDENRQKVEQALLHNEHKVICSTNALGMGIDKPDLRFVIHYHFPASPIHYYQEIGRAGRDGKVSYCILLYDKDDITIQENFIHSSKPASRYYSMTLAAIQQAPDGVRETEILLQTSIPSQTVVRTVLQDLKDQGFIQKDKTTYTPLPQFGQVDFSAYDKTQQQKLNELQAMVDYTSPEICYTNYLTSFLGDGPRNPCGTCGSCAKTNFPVVVPSEGLQQAVKHFLEEGFLPRIEKRGSRDSKHEEGWSLSYHGNSRIGRLVRHSKYENGGPFPEELVQRAAQVIRERYPLELIDAIVSIPPTTSGTLVETFAKRIANVLSITYVLTLIKVRETKEQKDFVNRAQKKRNVKDAFAVSFPLLVAGRTLLLIDDIYDSGYTLRAATKALIQAGALAVYPFTITRTLHSDDQ
jgi:ATP-dependent DNA helicase RecQ